jgi:hypothetical protein
MSTRHAKMIRRNIKKQKDKIKIEMLKQFFIFSAAQPFYKRLKLAIKILFKG